MEQGSRTITATTGHGETMQTAVFPSSWRAVAGLLVALGGGGLLLSLVLLTTGQAGLHNPLRLIRFVTGASLLPWAAAWLIHKAYVAKVGVKAGLLSIDQRHRRVEIPVEVITAIEPWRCPLPSSGLRLCVGTDEPSAYDLATRDPERLIQELRRSGVSHSLTRPQRASLVYATANAARGGRGFGAWFKFLVFGLFVTLPLFRVHQIIAYGGVLGEYHQYGLRPYLAGFAIYWASVTIYLLMYAAVLRMPVEILCFGVAAGAPSLAHGTRRFAEAAVAILYYAGVPAALILRFYPW